jgi:hypothetical protein
MQTRIRLLQICNNLRLIVRVDVIHFYFIRSYEINSIANRDWIDQTLDYFKSFLKKLSRRFRFRLNSNSIVDELCLECFSFCFEVWLWCFWWTNLQNYIFHHVSYSDREFSRLSISTRDRIKIFRDSLRYHRDRFDLLTNRVKIARFCFDLYNRNLHSLQNEIQLKISCNRAREWLFDVFLQNIDCLLQQRQRNRIIYDTHSM